MIKRTFNHKTFGLIGEVALDAAVTKMQIDGKDLPVGSVEYLLNFALQSLQDAYAGAKTQQEAVAMFAKKRDALIAGTIGVRVGGGSVDDETRIARNIVKGALKTKMGKDSADWKAFTGLSDADMNAKLDAVFAKNKDKLQPKVDAEVAALKAERERKAGLKAGLDLDL